MSLGRGGLGVRSRFPETAVTPYGGDFVGSARTGSQSAGPGASAPCVRRRSEALVVDHGQFVGCRLKDVAVVMGPDEIDAAAGLR